MIHTLKQLNSHCATQLSAIFTQILDHVPSPALKTAMEYILFNPGKLIRPMLIYAIGQLFDTDLKKLALPAAAIELVHTYSLVHDDLPAMDNADWRRGQLSCHKAHAEGIAILAGDALLTVAMNVLACYEAPFTPIERLKMIETLSHAIGPLGMIGGQALDLTSVHEPISKQFLERIYSLKTGALFTASVQLAYIASGQSDELAARSLMTFSQRISFAFQIQDDIFDFESSDLHNKDQLLRYNYVTLYGFSQAKRLVKALYEEAVDALHYFNHQSQELHEFIQWLAERKQ